mmetsp:Transcript_32434/g.89699  ORF Transcript_32434/g.89699 Transcript_32434/m.89699 type:complete len:758 (-) Transcript_32434:80-2353(-)
MAGEEELEKALAFLRKHDVSKTGALVPSTDLGAFDVEDPDALSSFDESKKRVGHEPVGPNWKKPGALAHLPSIAGHPDSAWLMHERQDANGKYKAWLFFSTKTGQYYRLNDLNDAKSPYKYMGTPHNPLTYPITVRVGNASVLSGDASRIDMSVLLPDLPKTGFLLKQPLEFLDKPACLFVLCAGLRNTSLASEFCARRFHSLFLPKLSSRATVWYDYELVEIVGEAVAALDKALLESPSCFAGCSLAVALVAGTRLVIAALGSVRCVLCRALPSAEKASLRAAAPQRWSQRLVAGGDAHTLADKGERARAEAEGGCVARGSCEAAEELLYAASAGASELAAISEEWGREVWRVTRATNSFAVLGVTVADVKEGAAALRRIFRRRSLIVHPDKVGEARRQQTTAVFSKLEAAADALDGMLSADAAAAATLARIHCACDEGSLAADPGVAAKLLGVEECCGASAAKKAAEKLQASLSRLQNVARQDVERAIKILQTAVESASRTGQLWRPADSELGVRVTRALGLKDLKQPVKLLGSGLGVEVVQLGLTEMAGLVLLTDGAESVSDADIARRCAQHAPGRPRAAALRIAIDGSEAAPPEKRRKAVTAVCAFFGGDGSTSVDSSILGPPLAKRARKPDRVRMSHVLLRWTGLKGEDEFERPGMPQLVRTQAEAERELLMLLEDLLADAQQKTLAARFKAEVLKRSECSTALNVPHADMGWLEPGGAEPALEAVAFETPVGGLSDVVVTSRGAHLMYRLA